MATETTSSLLFEIRDEGPLKLFFGDLVSSGGRARQPAVRSRRSSIGCCDMFRDLEPDARTGFFEDNQLYPYLSLLYGIELLEWMRDWCERTARGGSSLTEDASAASVGVAR